MSYRNFQSAAQPVKLNYGPLPSTEDENRVYDVCVIGSGASGSIAASRFVEAGLSVLMIEQGPFVEGTTSYEDIIRWSEPALARQSNGCWQLNGYPWTTCNVGGGTVFYGGASFRYRQVDFDASAYMGDADLPVAWPYTYENLAPYYDCIEQRIGIAAAPPESDPTHPPKRVGSLPAISPSPSARHLFPAAKRLGLNPFPTPLAIATIPHGNRPACDQSSCCIEHRCPTGSKGDVFTVFIRSLQAHPQFHLFAGIKAVRFVRRKRGTVQGVTAVRIDSGKEFNFKARYFVVACNAIQSAALLLRSSDHWSPDGIGNEHDMVGRGLCMKLNEYVVGYKDSKSNETTTDYSWPGGVGPFSTFALTDYYLNAECPTGMGGLIYEARYGQRYSMKPEDNILRLECILADQPSRLNRIALSDSKDTIGLPTVIIDYTAHPRDLARLEYMVSRCTNILEAAGCRWIRREAGESQLGSCHLHGTCRSGIDEKVNVLDVWSRVHTVDNLYVIDGSFMPFPGGLNPTLTIQAHALRIAEKIIELFEVN